MNHGSFITAIKIIITPTGGTTNNKIIDKIQNPPPIPSFLELLLDGVVFVVCVYEPLGSQEKHLLSRCTEPSNFQDLPHL
jgi:hypothetical protein